MRGGAVISPSSCGAKASSKNDVMVFFAPLSSLTYGWGVVGYKRREIGKPPSHFTKMIYELPDRHFCMAVVF